jgi:hypothetical protein
LGDYEKTAKLMSQLWDIIENAFFSLLPTPLSLPFFQLFLVPFELIPWLF